MKIFFDFDDFFLKTENDLVTDFFRLLMSLLGATEEDLRQTYKRFFGAHFSKGLPYSLEQHIDFLSELRSFDRETAKKSARAFFVNLKQYLFEGTEDFLKTLPKDDLYLLTFGEEKFQNLKVDGSGLRGFFREVIVVQGDKPEEIIRVAKREHFPENEIIVFADNRCGHFTGAKEHGIITIHLKRPTDKYSKEPCRGCQYLVSDFAELSGVLKKLSEKEKSPAR